MTEPIEQTGPYVPGDASTPDAALPSPRLDDTLPTNASHFGDFELLNEIGREGPFVLVRARQPRLDRLVLLKMPPPGTTVTDELRTALRQEAEAAARLQHPGIVRVLETGTHDDIPYLAFAHADGELLTERLKRGPVPERLAADWARQLAETVFMVHQQGQLHRNLQPEFVYVGRDGQLRLSGFGTADRPWPTTGILAPERTPGWSRQPDARVDVYGLGALLYTMLTTRLPFEASSPEELIDKVREAEPPSPRRFNPAVSRELGAVCLMCLQYSPHLRYHGEMPVKPLIADLRRFLSHRPVTARPSNAARRLVLWGRRNLRPLAVAGLVVIGLVVPALWDRYRANAAWWTLTRSDVSPEQHAAAARFFEQIAMHRPYDDEAATGLALGRVRTGQPEQAAALLPITSDDDSWRQLSRYFPQLRVNYHGSDPSWKGAQMLTWAMRAMYEGRFTAASSAIEQARRRDGTRTSLEQRLVDELQAARADSDIVARSVATGDRDGIAHAATLQPTPELVKALILQTANYIHSRDELWLEHEGARLVVRANAGIATQARQSLDKLEPNWLKHEGARRAIPGLALQLAAPDNDSRQTAATTLAAIDPKWASSPEAREAIPGLLLRLAQPRPVDHGGDPEAVLRQIDANWQRSAETRATVSQLMRRLTHQRRGLTGERVLFHGAYDGYGRIVYTLAALGPTAAEAEPELRRLLTDSDEVIRSLALTALGAIVPDWAQTEWGRQAMTDLLARLGSSRPEVRAAAATALSRVNVPDRPAVIRSLVLTLPDEAALDVLPQLDTTWNRSEGARQAVTDLVRRLESGTPVQRAHAAWVLAQLGPLASPALPILLQRLTDADDLADVDGSAISHRVRQWLNERGTGAVSRGALKALGEIDANWRQGDEAKGRLPGIVRTLLERIEDKPDPMNSAPAWRYREHVQQVVADVCTHPLETEEVGLMVPWLRQRFDTNNDAIRTLLAKVLAWAGWRAAGAIPALAAAAERQPGGWEQEVRQKECAAALVQVLRRTLQSGKSLHELRQLPGGGITVAALVKLLGHDSFEVRRVAGELLEKLEPNWREAAP